ncbi:DUF29 family protein [Crocosphaera sp. UHCC 0190]|uniref:DUF29 family protein n=1 Tax=Crocosphaera sp. UHCC 0190 TaxID=3110246 RepID=UPI002B21595A|nr:DUF29 family protein [Crocosphaera sp. UHCC 0190]MEA5509548.1 DUF29 family protein [Crocosphaera sp. UHCC 0190]
MNRILIAHVLKLIFQKDAPDSMKASWYSSITENRFRVQQDLLANPSFKSYLDEALSKAYNDGEN